MNSIKQLSDRKIIRKMSQQLGMLDRTLLENNFSINSNSRRTMQKLKSLWSAWDEDPSVRPVICQRIKIMTFKHFFDRTETMYLLAEIISNILSTEAKVLSKEVVLHPGTEQITVRFEDHSETLNIDLKTVLNNILNVSETTEH